MKAIYSCIDIGIEETSLEKISRDYSKVLQLPDIFHCIRVAILAEELCYKLRLNRQRTKEVFISAILHDIGKSMIEKEILNKNTQLSPLEWRAIKHHPELGGIIASSMGHDAAVIKNIVHHHENYDGSGYPRRIMGNKIPIGAQIIRLCDTYDAIRMERPYKKPYSHEEALEVIKKESIKHNPYLLKLFWDLDFARVKTIMNEEATV